MYIYINLLWVLGQSLKQWQDICLKCAQHYDFGDFPPSYQPDNWEIGTSFLLNTLNRERNGLWFISIVGVEEQRLDSQNALDPEGTTVIPKYIYWQIDTEVGKMRGFSTPYAQL